MANDKVMFKRGSQANLATATIVNGAFYLTSDTNRLYIGKDGKAVPVNQGVITVENVNALTSITAEQGQFYYAEAQNVLCIKSGNKWVQINPDTDTAISKRAITSSANAEDNFVTVTDTVYQQTNGEGLETPHASKFEVKGGAGVTVTVEEITETVNDKTVSYPRLVITPAAYSLTATLNNVAGTVDMTMTNGSGATSTVTISKGDNVSFESTEDNKFKISAEDTVLSSASLGFNDAGNLTVTVADSREMGNTVSASITPTIQYGVEEDGSASDTKAKFDANGNLLLSVYTATQIDNMIRGLDAMVYKGTITTLPGTDVSVSVGDTYKVASDTNQIVIDGVKARKGDIVIAKSGTETNGVITGTIEWDLIPAGDDSMTDTLYKAVNIENGIQLVEDNLGAAIKGGIQIASNDYLTVSDEDVAVTGEKNLPYNKVTVAHKETLTTEGKTVSATEADRTQKTGEEFSFSIPVLEYDKAGHIISVASELFKVKDTIANYELTSIGATAASSAETSGVLASSATITTVLTDKTEGSIAGSQSKAFNITSSSLVLAKDDAGNLAMDIEWGSFDPVV